MLQTKFNHQQTAKPGLPPVEVRELNAIGGILHFTFAVGGGELNAIGVILHFILQTV